MSVVVTHCFIWGLGNVDNTGQGVLRVLQFLDVPYYEDFRQVRSHYKFLAWANLVAQARTDEWIGPVD
jgi:hypothetical protein